jgi:hypothetical protein
VPEEVLTAKRQLVELGYGNHLISEIDLLSSKPG